MSDPLRIAAAVEGPTDAIVVQAVIEALLPETEFEFQTVQPETSAAFSTTGAGWVGVYRWSRQTVEEGGGSFSGSAVLSFHDVVILQIDADVAGTTYASGSISDAPGNDLPCEKSCPPPTATTNELRSVVLNWLGEKNVPSQLIFCMPSKSMETWVFAALCPDNRMVKRPDWECRDNPESQMGTLPKAQRFGKTPADYRARRGQMIANWSSVASRLSEAARFQSEFLTAVEGR